MKRARFIALVMCAYMAFNPIAAEASAARENETIETKDATVSETAAESEDEAAAPSETVAESEDEAAAPAETAAEKEDAAETAGDIARLTDCDWESETPAVFQASLGELLDGKVSRSGHSVTVAGVVLDTIAEKIQDLFKKNSKDSR